jgi:hypothetical protein
MPTRGASGPQKAIPLTPSLDGDDNKSLAKWIRAMSSTFEQLSDQVGPLIYANTVEYETGVVTLDFGAGAVATSTVVTGITGITAPSIVTAELRIEATAEHTEDDLLNDPIRVAVSSLVVGTGFTIEGFMDNAPANGTYQVNWIFY